MEEACEKLLVIQSLICQQLHDIPWSDDWEYICWSYLTGAKSLPVVSPDVNRKSDEKMLLLLESARELTAKINGWVNDITYFEMDRWLILYKQWEARYPDS
ncbi:MAG: hypothetical protein WBA74_03080 [Cyclobacteriaceae bacterium]